MNKDIITKKIIEILKELDDEKKLEEIEYLTLATLVALVLDSDKKSRNIFYKEVMKVSDIIVKDLEKRADELFKIIINNKKKKIIN